MSAKTENTNRLIGRPRARRGRDRAGSTIVQAAIVLPIVLMFLFGILEYSRYVMLLQVMTNAAREGCRYAVMHTDSVTINTTTYGSATSNVDTIITNMLGGQTLSSQSIGIYASDALGNNVGTWEDAAAGQWITVKITGNFNSILPKLLGMSSTIPITAEVVMRSEGN
ncbi:MAG TPA: TadE/TadG family type IV pilus assembly protein [Pirellulales bacterium]|nr:TadE/TadG family type IV pilus assembly protein [Pirellulales bacterium]